MSRLKMLKRLDTIYAAANCEACGSPSHYGELIAVLVPEVIFTGYDSYKVIKHYKQVCPSCYKEALNERLRTQYRRLNNE